MAHNTLLPTGTDGVPEGILRAGDSAYAEAVTTMTGAGTPDLVIRPRTAEEVALAVTYARTHDQTVTVRAGGHSVAGLSTVSEGLLLDLRGMDRIQVDPATRLVRVGGGATWGHVAETLRPHGLGLTAGDTAGVGVGGLTLGGGIGWMVRQHGLAIDNLVGAQVVTADGQVREVSVRQRPDLFWALRGRGHGLGVVTRFDFVAQEVRDVVFGTVALAVEDPVQLLAAWRDVQVRADERLTTTLALMPAPGEQPLTAMLGVCFAGPEAEAAPLLARLRGLGAVLSDDVTVRPYAEVLVDEEAPPPGMRIAMHNTLLPHLTDGVLEDVAALLDAPPTMVSLRSLGGAFARVPEGATAFPSRSAEAMVIAVRFSTDPEDPSLAQLPGWEQVARHGTGSYGNFRSVLPSADADPAATTHRLARLRGELDPTGLFGPADGSRREVAS